MTGAAELQRRAYGALLTLATPPYLAALWRRGRIEATYREGWDARLGLTLPPPGPYVWFHAVSMGEALAAIPLMNALRRRHPGERFLATCSTPAGMGRLRAAFGEDVHVCWLPLDHGWSVRRFVKRVRPRLCAVVETELWPNLLHALGGAGVPVVWVNARLSERSLRRYRKFRLFRAAADAIDRVVAQGDADARRFVELGVPPDRVTVGGNLKAGFAVPYAVGCEARAARDPRPTWLAASTHPGEEAAVLDAHARLLEARPEALLVVAPRHPDRFDPVAQASEQRGWRVARRSLDQAAGAKTEVLLVDTFGELRGLYGLADLVFVGGSLAVHGGHNPLEAAAWGCPLLMGPSRQNVAAPAAALADAGALRAVESARALSAAIVDLLGDAEARARMGAAARTCVTTDPAPLQHNLAACEAAMSRPLA